MDTQFYFWDNFGNSASILTILSLYTSRNLWRVLRKCEVEKSSHSQCQYSRSEALSLSDMINNHFCSMSRIVHVKNSRKFYLPPPTRAGRIKLRVTGTRGNSWLASLLGRLVLLDSDTGLRSPGFAPRVFAFSSCLTVRFSCSSQNLSNLSHLLR